MSLSSEKKLRAFEKRTSCASCGERITVSGSVAFKATAIRAAVDARLPIVFTDPILERRRLVEAALG